MMRLCTNRNAAPVPSTTATKKAMKVTRMVLMSARSKVGASAKNVVATSLGVGMRKEGILKARQSSSHKASMISPDAIGGAIARKRSDLMNGEVMAAPGARSR